MAAILSSLGRTVLAGFILLVVIVVVAGLLLGDGVVTPSHGWAANVVMRWLHVLSGLMWVGLLYYLNFVQIPTMPRITPIEHRAAITRFIAPAVLFWFRYAALATVVTGLLLAIMNRYVVDALLLHKAHYPLGIGMWLGLIMAINVWFVIWPNQQRALGLVDCPADQRPKAARIAMLVSRVNVMLSIPMLFCMVAQQNGGF
jgi:uncharacterized membrane protein